MQTVRTTKNEVQLARSLGKLAGALQLSRMGPRDIAGNSHSPLIFAILLGVFAGLVTFKSRSELGGSTGVGNCMGQS